jgi:protein ImuB
MNYAALYFQDLSLNCLLAREQIPPDQPAALLSHQERKKSHLIASNQAAQSMQISPGLSSTRALARYPELLLLSPDVSIEQSTRIEVLAFVETLTPNFEATTPEIFLFQLSTTKTHSISEWINDTIKHSSTILNLPLRIGLGKTPDLAHLSSISENSEKPLELKLTTPALSRHFFIPHLETLNLWGIKTLKDLAALPRQGLSERLGTQIAQLHDIIHGKYHRRLTLHQSIKRYQSHHHFSHPIENHTPLLFVAKRIFRTLCNQLQNHQRAAEKIQLTLLFENQSTHTRDLPLFEPTCKSHILLRTFHTYLEDFTAPAPILELHLELQPTLTRHAQYQLFQKSLKDPNQFGDTLKKLTEIVGASHLGIPQNINTHHPDHFKLHPIDTSFQIPALTLRTPRSHLPLKRQRPPLHLQVASEKRNRFLYPLALLTGPYQGSVLKTRGPFPLSGSWWDEGWQQIQWDIELKNTLLQLTFTPPKMWTLTGVYG